MSSIPKTSAVNAPVAIGTAAALGLLSASAALARNCSTDTSFVGPIRLYPNRNTPNACDSR